MKPYACPICNFDSIHQVQCSHCGQSVCRDCLNACFETSGVGQDNRNVTMKCPTCKEPTFRYSNPTEIVKSPHSVTNHATRAIYSARLRDHATGEMRDQPPSSIAGQPRLQHLPRTAESSNTNRENEEATKKPTLVWFQSPAIENVWWPATLYSSHLVAQPLMKQDDFCSPFQNEIMKQYILEVSGFPPKPVVCLFGHPDEQDAATSSQFHNNAPTWWYPVHADDLTQPFTLANLGDFFADAPTKHKERLQRIMSSRVVPLLTDDNTQSITRAAPKSVSSIFRKPAPLQIEVDDNGEELLIDRLPPKVKKSQSEVSASKSQNSYQEVTEWLSKLNESHSTGRPSDENELLRRATKTKNASYRSSQPGTSAKEQSRLISSSRIPVYNPESGSNGSPRKDNVNVRTSRR